VAMPVEQPQMQQPPSQPMQQPQMSPQQPFQQQPQQFQTAPQVGYAQSMTSGKSGILGLIDQKAGIMSLIVYGIAFAILSIATLIYLNNLLSDLKTTYAAYNITAQAPTLFETAKDIILKWVFVNGISAWWWVLGLLPALGLAGYSLYKTKFKNIFAIITVVLVLEVYLNLIIK